MKRIGLIALTIVLSLGLLGVGFAEWTETLNIDGTADMGDLCVFWDWAVSNDDGSECTEIWCDGLVSPPDPGDDGLDPSAHQTAGGARPHYTMDVASTSVDGAQNEDDGVPADGYHELTVEILNAYPSYWDTIFFSITPCIDSIPAKVASITIVEVDYVDAGGATVIKSVNQEILPCEEWCVDVDSGTVHKGDCIECEDDFMLHISSPDAARPLIGTIIADNESVCGDLDIHVLQCDYNEGRKMSFKLAIEAVPFNV